MKYQTRGDTIGADTLRRHETIAMPCWYKRVITIVVALKGQRR